MINRVCMIDSGLCFRFKVHRTFFSWSFITVHKLPQKCGKSGHQDLSPSPWNGRSGHPMATGTNEWKYEMKWTHDQISSVAPHMVTVIFIRATHRNSYKFEYILNAKHIKQDFGYNSTGTRVELDLSTCERKIWPQVYPLIRRIEISGLRLPISGNGVKDYFRHIYCLAHHTLPQIGRIFMSGRFSLASSPGFWRRE